MSKTPEGTSSKVSRLQRRMELAGWTDPEAAGYYALAETVMPIICGLLPLALMGTRGWLLAIVAAVLGYLIPDLVLTRATRRHQKAIQNGLPDAIDLIVVCVEAGSSLDQAIMRASEELELALPALARELRTVTNEIRAGKPRLEAFQGLAKRTQVEDVRALVHDADADRPVRHQHRPGAQNPRLDVADQATSARRRARRESGRQAGISACAVSRAGTVRRVPRSSRHQDHPRADVMENIRDVGRSISKEERCG